ncbi:hypothetical protein [Mycolicibacterium aichiense]|uniref:Uncharacterized protein n=1 Tax=Mycolicibacterium aichiense TaxID=1799 RepID=A0AAD1HP09_9MYCO|nr:hypothetical protein [Mycolicibacterium aichiense]MCV7018584.1 hypothetical protein [Mycolicibacterium aichiense]BBX07341.1 hypothetical protein MAIC_21440 [Mycolicibacterium aichiense]STZ81155.1 Uncharacterised protein [Mycolicibacterium aichiense]
MTETGKQTTVEAPDLTDELRESAKAGQHAAGQALRKFRDAVDDAIPESVAPLRDKIVQAALDLADDLVSAQYKFHRSLLNTADRALTKSDTDD